jgi:hypothetical protein
MLSDRLKSSMIKVPAGTSIDPLLTMTDVQNRHGLDGDASYYIQPGAPYTGSAVNTWVDTLVGDVVVKVGDVANNGTPAGNVHVTSGWGSYTAMSHGLGPAGNNAVYPYYFIEGLLASDGSLESIYGYRTTNQGLKGTFSSAQYYSSSAAGDKPFYEHLVVDYINSTTNAGSKWKLTGSHSTGSWTSYGTNGPVWGGVSFAWGTWDTHYFLCGGGHASAQGGNLTGTGSTPVQAYSFFIG